MHPRKTSLLVRAALAVLFVFSAALLPAETPDSLNWSPEFSMQFPGIRGTAISPDGSLIAYVVRTAIMDGEKSEYRSHIHIVSADGKSDIQYTRGEKSCSNPAFSPDGEWLGFTSARGGKKNQVWRIRIRGGEAEQITEAENGVAAWRWSPDGRSIAYTMRDPETEAEKKRKKEKRDVILVDKNFKYNHLYRISVEKNNEGKRDVQRLTRGDFHITAFDWSPDGTTIVFSHQKDPRINTGFLNSRISTVPADSGAVTALVSWGGANRQPRYSPDGRWVAFTSHGGSPQPVGLSDLYIIPAQGGQPKKLHDTGDRNASLIGWSRNGKSLIYSEAAGTTRHIFALPVDGGAAKPVSRGQGVAGSVSLAAKTDRMAFTWQTLTSPAEVHISSTRKFSPKKLTRINAEITLPEMGRTEVIRWTSKDGLEIEGLLTYPIGYEEGKKYPLILNVHGGPAGVFLQRFTGSASIYLIQYFAENGFFVLRPNPRGSTGYGKKFRYANVRDWGYGDYEDLLSGVDLAIERGLAHPDSLCLMGWSYGGYMTSFMVTRTQRFKAASMGAGLPNLISMTTTTDIPDYLVAHMGGKEFWQDYEVYEKHSAIYRIAHVTTPTQVIHGARDLRVPFTQGQEFYVALSRKGVPTEMIVYPRTPHGPREPKFVMDVSPRILNWFNQHLGR